MLAAQSLSPAITKKKRKKERKEKKKTKKEREKKTTKTNPLFLQLIMIISAKEFLANFIHENCLL